MLRVERLIEGQAGEGFEAKDRVLADVVGLVPGRALVEETEARVGIGGEFGVGF